MIIATGRHPAIPTLGARERQDTGDETRYSGLINNGLSHGYGVRNSRSTVSDR